MSQLARLVGTIQVAQLWGCKFVLGSGVGLHVYQRPSVDVVDDVAIFGRNFSG